MGNNNDERAPLLQQLPPMPTVLDDDDEIGGAEGIVCDNHPHRKRVMLRRSSILLLIITILSIITVYSVRIYSNIEATVNESLEMTVKDIQFDGINTDDKSINLILSVDSSLNYSNSEFDIITKRYLIWNSYLINNLNVDIDNINITINTSANSKPVDSIGVVKIEPFNLKIYQGVTDNLQLKVNIKPDSLSIFKAVKNIVLNKSLIEMDGEFMLKIKVGYLRIPIKNMKLNFDNIIIDPSELINELYDHHVKLQDLELSEDRIKSSLSVISPHEDPMLTKYISYIPSIPDSVYANLLVEGCNEFFTLIELKLEGLSGFMDHSDNNNLTLKSPNLLPSRFFEKCEGNTSSPLSNLIQSIAYNKPTTNFLIKSSAKNTDLFPIWVNQEILDNIAIPYHIPTLSNMQVGETRNSIIQNVSIGNLDLNVDNGIDRPQLGSGDIKFDINLPFAIDLKDLHISNLKGLVDLKYQGLKFGFIDIDDWLKCHTKKARTVCQLYQNDITVTNGQVYLKLIGDYLMGEDLEIQVDFVVSALVDWKLVYADIFEINGLSGSGSGSL